MARCSVSHVMIEIGLLNDGARLLSSRGRGGGGEILDLRVVGFGVFLVIQSQRVKLRYLSEVCTA